MKQLSAFELNFAGMMFVRSSKIIPHLVIIRGKNMAVKGNSGFLLADPLNIFSCEITSPNDLFVDKNNESEILCRIHHFIWIWLKKWPPWVILVSDWVKMIMNTNNINPIIMKLFNIVGWMSDCCLMPNEQLFSYIKARTSYIQWNDGDVFFVLDQHAELYFYSASSLKQQSTG